MCIRDRIRGGAAAPAHEIQPAALDEVGHGLDHAFGGLVKACLLYTSDAADERSSVDLGGRRIIKKKTNKQIDHVSARDQTKCERAQQKAGTEN